MDEYKLILKSAFKEVEEQELRNIPEDSEIDYKFSPQFEKKMNRLIKAQRHSYWNYVNTTSKKIAVFLIAAVISLTCVMSVEASRNAIIKFFGECKIKCVSRKKRNRLTHFIFLR